MSILDDFGDLFGGVGSVLGGVGSGLAGALGSSLGDIAGLALFGLVPQPDRPILILVMGPTMWGHWFFPKPEDLVYTNPVRATPLQTLGGAYVDDFGQGVCEISLSGLSSYKNGPLDSLLDGLGLGGVKSGKSGCGIGLKFPDQGELLMMNLRKWVVRDFHDHREKLARLGRDPDEYQMFFVDVLNWQMWKVFPIHFQIRRNKQRPLLHQYTLRMIGLQDVLTGI